MKNYSWAPQCWESCYWPPVKRTKETTNVNDMATDGEAMHHEINTDSVVHVINGLREGLEMKASRMDKVEIPTDSLREKIKRNGPNLIST